jgi:hypothetical protein
MKNAMKTSGICFLAAAAVLLFLPGASHGSENSVYSRDSAKWYIGFGIGGGGGRETHNVTPCDSTKAGVNIMIKAGWVLRHDFLVGYDVAAYGVRADYSGQEYMLVVQHHDLMATHFPFDSLGLFVKGGIGIASRSWDEADNLITFDFDFGFDMRAGAGYEFQLGRAFNLGLEIGYAVSFFKAGTSQDAFALVSFSWY